MKRLTEYTNLNNSERFDEEQMEYACKLIDDFSKFVGCTTFEDFMSRDYIEQFKKDKGLIPTLEVGKWYNGIEKDGNPKCIAMFKGWGVETYGVNIGFSWIDNAYWFADWSSTVNDWRPATNEEVEAALIAEAKKRGYKEGVTVFDSFTTSGCQYKIRSQSAYSFRNGTLRLGVVMLMCDGCWSTIVDTKLNDLEKKYKELGEEIERLKN